MARRLLHVSAGAVALLVAACGSGGGSTGGSGEESVEATSITSPIENDTGSSEPTDTSPSSSTADTEPPTATTTTTLVPAVGGGYELQMVDAQRPYIRLEGGTCDLAQPWSARLDPVGGGLAGTLQYTPSGDGTSGSVTVTFEAPGTPFAMTGTTSYSITAVDEIAGVPTTDETSTTVEDVPDGIDPGELPAGSLRISYGAITFTVNQPGAIAVPTLPGEIWGPRLLVPAPRDC